MSATIPTSCQCRKSGSPASCSSCASSGSTSTAPTRSPLVKGSVVMLLTALVDMLVAFSTAYWATWSREPPGGGGGAAAGEGGETALLRGGYGLWKMWTCPPGVQPLGHLGTMFHLWESEVEGECSVRMADSSYPGWYVGVQVLQTVGLAGLLAASLLLLLYIFWPRCHRNKRALSAVIGVCYSSGLFMVVGLFLFGFKVAEEIQDSGSRDWALSWSFSLACISFLLSQIAASVLIAENKTLSWEPQRAGCWRREELVDDSVSLLLPEPHLTAEQELEDEFEHYMRKKKKLII